MHPFVLALLGGTLLGLSATLLHVLLGRTAGISGIVGGLVDGGDDPAFRIAFAITMALVGLGLGLGGAPVFGPVDASLPVVVLGGLLVGFGTRLGNGCTSGHGVCGLSKRSPRSLAATMTFLSVGALTVAIVRGVSS